MEKNRIPINLSLGYSKEDDVPIDLPCHAYALGILCNYNIGDFIGHTVDKYTPDYEFVEILMKELLDKFHIKLSEVENTLLKDSIRTRTIMITRMSTPCKDYHFYLYHPDGSISNKFRNSKPQFSQNIDLNPFEYSLGLYSINRAS